MKHYVLANDRADLAKTGPEVPERIKYIDVILSDTRALASAEIVVEFYHALNSLVENCSYVVNLRVSGNDSVGGPLYWAGRTAIFWGDLENNWDVSGSRRTWISQVLNLSSRTVLVGGAVLLLVQMGRAGRHIVAVHPNFAAAALESGLESCGAATHLAADGHPHSATSRLSALRLLSEFVSIDHGEHIADALRSYIGLTEPTQKYESRLAARLVHRAKGDLLVVRTLDAMQENIEDPLTISDLSRLLKTSTRQLQRRFLSKTGAKLLSTYKDLRLERAQNLLQFTNMSQIEISAATGFSSPVALKRAFQRCYKTSPDDVRDRRFMGSMAPEGS
ncbi:helix-turn-helix domain-containing protein [Ruegeria atlantica]|uniref:Helix-turn-helix domain-containing protein n=1 Tax=Ruegeria atlantica TaxID=81569 RepID=A0ABX1WHS9_9RHOB|nr:helix-turn-helix domain-containing protein [Ruegeria atlantica]NOD32900.1 helix-turn-helix domain-containing protein [Ruegeria atlantica]